MPFASAIVRLTHLSAGNLLVALGYHSAATTGATLRLPTSGPVFPRWCSNPRIRLFQGYVESVSRKRNERLVLEVFDLSNFKQLRVALTDDYKEKIFSSLVGLIVGKVFQFVLYWILNKFIFGSRNVWLNCARDVTTVESNYRHSR